MAFRYADIQPITEYIVPQKQQAKRHYGSHQYFTKRPWNVIQEYIKRFTNKGDVVCDPYGGSGVAVIEALVLGRKGIYVDISPWATFLARQVAEPAVDLLSLGEAFQAIETECRDYISGLWDASDSSVASLPKQYWYPKNCPLPTNADVPLVENLFSDRQLLALSSLWNAITNTQTPVERDLLKYVFSATLYMCNRTFLSAKGRKASRGGSSIFSIYRYKVAKEPVELNVWDVFRRRYSRLLACKEETNNHIAKPRKGSQNASFHCCAAQDMSKYLKQRSVDYIFTDPPYGANIAYLDLTRMWDAWFGFEIDDQTRDDEAIEGGDVQHSAEDYMSIMKRSFEDMFRVLKYDRWMSLVFAHREPALWDGIVKAAESAGFEYVNTVHQSLPVVWSMHKKKNPLTVISGELILNFRKVKNPRTLAISTVGSQVVNIIKDSAELTIVEHHGASTEQIVGDLIPRLLENGMLGRASSELPEMTDLLASEFVYDEDNETWHLKPNTKLGCHIPLEHRIRFYVTDYLKRCERLGDKATVEDIVFSVLPKLKNGSQPTEQHIIEEIRKIAVPSQGKYWVLPDGNQGAFDFFAEASDSVAEFESIISTPASKLEHNEVLYALAVLGRNAGFACHIGKKEQAAEWRGTKLSEISSDLSFLKGVEKFTADKIDQIDLIWLENGVPLLAFEVEHSTAITSGIDRFIELLKVYPKMSNHIALVCPSRRRKKLDSILSSSHYIGTPMYMDRKLSYLWYSQVADLCKGFAKRQVTKPTLLKAALERMNKPVIE